MSLDRRKFLIGSGALAALGVVGGVTTVTIDDLTSAAHDRPRADGTGVVVVVTLYGGNDGINTVVPYSNNAYHDARPELAYAESDVLHLDSELGLNPAMKGLHSRWSDGSLAIIRGVGYPKPDHSHFRSMDIWQTASPDEPLHTGWVGRWLDATGDDPLRAVNIGSVLPTLAVGEKATAAALSPGSSPLDAAAVSTLAALGVRSSDDSGARSMVRSSYDAERVASETFRPIVTGTTGGTDAVAAGAAKGKKNASSLSSQLELVGKCVKAGVPTRVYSVSLGGFDTHADERGTQQKLLGELDTALSSFLTDMSSSPRGRDVVVMAYSEFGRRVAANASQGTDHGTAGPVFVAGSSVKGGFYGDEPSLTDLDDGDLKVTTDFRDVYAELLGKAVGTDPTPAVGTGRRPVGFL